jgi:long-chain acyl-CoA synthetase
VGFTSGSTAVPKGFIRSHRSWTESFHTALASFGPGAAERVLAPGRLSHSLFLFAALLGLWTGAGVHLQDRFSPVLCLDLLAADAAGCLVGVPSQILLVLEAAERRKRPPIEGLRLVLIGGARWPRRETVRLRARFPNARIVEFYGTSETSLVAWTDSDPDLPEAVVGRPFENVELSIRDADEPGSAGPIFVRSPMLFDGYVSGDDGSLLRDGDWISVRDMGLLDGSGRLVLLGRQRRMIVTAGRNLFPEEVEAVLEAHPAVAGASVLGVRDAIRGSLVLALLQPSGTGTAAPGVLASHCRALLPAHKVPREFVWCVDWPRTASGKTDHARLAALHGRCRT